MSERLNLLRPEVRENPYPYYAELRRQGPVLQVDPGGLWAVTCYDEVLSVLKNPQRFSSEGLRLAAEPPWLGRTNPISNSILLMDPPRHGRLRTLISRAFGPGLLTRMEPLVRAFAEERVTRLLERRAVDFVDEFSLQIPAYVISLLLGLDASLRPHFKRWGDDLVGITTTTPEDTGRLDQIRRSIEEMEHYLGEVLASRRHAPGDDLVSELLRARVDGEALTHEELMGFLSLLLVAGLETTMHLLSQSARMLMAHPEMMERLRADPSHLPRFLDEVLRYEPPGLATLRICTEDTELGGVSLPRGTPLLVLQASACHDERHFPDAARFDPERPGPQNLPFGHGIHFCLGAPLARLEARVSMEALLARVARLTPGAQPPEWVESLTIRGLRKLPVEVHPA